MKKMLYAIFSIAIFTACSFNVKADEFDYNSCINACRGDDERICKASCDARKDIEEKKEGCSGNQLCMDKWEASFPSKRDFYLQCYNGTSNGKYNYCTHDSNACYSKCLASSYLDKRNCEADCAAKDKIKKCIVSSYNTSEINKCISQYSEHFKEYQGDVITKPDDNTGTSVDYATCKSQCNSSNMQECDSKCYAQSKVQECIDGCGTSTYGDCSKVCQESYNFYYNQRFNTYDPYSKVECGDYDIPYAIPQIVRTIIVILQIATPIIIIMLGSVDLVKAMIAQKEDEIKKGQQTFIRRAVVGVLVFLVFAIVRLAVGLVAPENENNNMWNCVDCFVNGECKTK